MWTVYSVLDIWQHQSHISCVQSYCIFAFTFLLCWSKLTTVCLSKLLGWLFCIQFEIKMFLYQFRLLKELIVIISSWPPPKGGLDWLDRLWQSWHQPVRNKGRGKNTCHQSSSHLPPVRFSIMPGRILQLFLSTHQPISSARQMIFCPNSVCHWLSNPVPVASQCLIWETKW